MFPETTSQVTMGSFCSFSISWAHLPSGLSLCTCFWIAVLLMWKEVVNAESCFSCPFFLGQIQ